MNKIIRRSELCPEIVVRAVSLGPLVSIRVLGDAPFLFIFISNSTQRRFSRQLIQISWLLVEVLTEVRHCELLFSINCGLLVAGAENLLYLKINLHQGGLKSVQPF